MTFIAYGTYKLSYDDAYYMTKEVLNNNYYYIDTAQLYKNEEAVGRAIKDSNIPRDDIFLITKIHIKEIRNGYEWMEKSVTQSLEILGTHIDLLLLHGYNDIDDWLNLEKIYLKYKDEGKIKYIGVSNYNYQQIENLLKISNIKPYLNQIELSPFFVRKEIVELCQNNNIKVMAHTLFSQNKIKYSENSVLTEISNKYNVSPHQIIIQWCLQQNISIVIGSKNIDHLVSNLNIKFKLEKDDLDKINLLNNNFIIFKQHILK
jgi:diketogulonate reductase-like aldo/keto reductase